VSYSPEGPRLATACVDGTARLWDATTGGLLEIFSGHRARVSSVAFSPDGARLATASDDFTAKLWDVSRGLEIRTFAGHTLRVWRVVFSPDGVHLATGSADGTARIWDTTTGNEVFTLRGQAGVINPIYSRDGTRLSTAATDGSVKVWDALSGRERLMLETSSPSATRAAFSPDGSRLAVASQNNTAGVYFLRQDELVALAQQRVTRGLTPDECQRFLHVDHCPGTITPL
jgi:WD40 repeat protein